MTPSGTSFLDDSEGIVAYFFFSVSKIFPLSSMWKPPHFSALCDYPNSKGAHLSKKEHRHVPAFYLNVHDKKSQDIKSKSMIPLCLLLFPIIHD